MQGQIAGATPLSQLIIYMNNCLQFWVTQENITQNRNTNGNIIQGIHGQFHVKSPRKMSSSKTKFFMMKYERAKGYVIVFTVPKPNFSFGANLGQQLKLLKK